METINIENTLRLLEILSAQGKHRRYVKSKKVYSSSANFLEIASLAHIETEVDKSALSEYLLRFTCHYSNQPASWKYSCYLFYLISNVMDQMDLNSPQAELSDTQKNSILHAIQECYKSSLGICVKRHENRVSYNTTNQSETEYQRLLCSLRMFDRIFTIKLPTSFDDAKLDFTIGVLSVITLQRSQADITEFAQIFANAPTKLTSDLVFKFLMMVKGFNGFPKEFQLLVHRELMTMIRSPNGFLVLCRNLVVNPNDSQVPLWQKCAMISKITESVALNKTYRKAMIDEIFRSLDESIKAAENDIAGACVYVIHSLISKEDVELQDAIQAKILNELTEFIQPDNQVHGSIIMERSQIDDIINRLHVLFSPTTIKAIPSSILFKHIAVLFDLYVILPESPEREKLAHVIAVFLNNRDRKELQAVIENLRLKQGDLSLRLYPRIVYFTNALVMREERNLDDCYAFVQLLRTCNINVLNYEVFLCLINILGDVQTSGDNFLAEYNVDEENLPFVLHRKFFKKLAILEPLQEMTQWPSLHSQLNEKPKEVLDAIKAVLLKNVEKNRADEQLMVIFFSLFKELVGKLRDEDQRLQMEQDILLIKDKCRSQKLREQIEAIFSVKVEIPTINPSEMAFEDAMTLIHSSEVYCKVYGADTLIKLLRKADYQALANRHTILAVALQNLKETESYAYLNVIRLLVALTLIMKDEVIEALVAEYQNQDLSIDNRLKVGEVIIKVTEDLGALAGNYKDSLIQCFLRGSSDSTNEFRTSSLVNLGTITQILSYQIFNFFNEMMQQLEIILRSDDYLPAKRAAAMVLSQVLAGIPNLIDFQEVLLPIYRLLKEILANESDQQTRTHAAIGLDHLNAKTRDFLNPDMEMSKRIKIEVDNNPNKLDDIKFK